MRKVKHFLWLWQFLNFLGFISHNHKRTECETMKPRTRKATALPVQPILLQVHVSCSVQEKTAEKNSTRVSTCTRCGVGRGIQYKGDI